MGANSLNVNDEKLQMSQREPESLTKQKSKETKGNFYILLYISSLFIHSMELLFEKSTLFLS